MSFLLVYTSVCSPSPSHLPCHLSSLCTLTPSSASLFSERAFVGVFLVDLARRFLLGLCQHHSTSICKLLCLTSNLMSTRNRTHWRDRTGNIWCTIQAAAVFRREYSQSMLTAFCTRWRALKPCPTNGLLLYRKCRRTVSFFSHTFLLRRTVSFFPPTFLCARKRPS